MAKKENVESANVILVFVDVSSPDSHYRPRQSFHFLQSLLRMLQVFHVVRLEVLVELRMIVLHDALHTARKPI